MSAEQPRSRAPGRGVVRRSSGQSPQHADRVAFDQVQQHQRRALGVAVANFPNDVWLYDQGSSRGIPLDGNAVQGREFLDGVHRVMVGRNEFEVGARAELLV